MKRIYLSIAFLCLWFVQIIAQAEQLTIIYPHVSAPYDEIYEQINKGISSVYPNQINQIKLPSTFNPSNIADTITSNKVIALGKRGLTVAKYLSNETSVAIGALPIRPNGFAGVSLVSSPESLFNSLNQLAPHIKHISVVFTEKSSWIIGEATKQAKLKGLTLETLQVEGMKDAAKAYNKIFDQKIELDNHAIWLPLDGITANEKVIVPVILEKAWERRMVVFSSKPNHAKRGALFSAVPDNFALGEQLAKFIINEQLPAKVDNELSHVSPLTTIKLAVNLRTASHLGMNYSPKERANFAMTFPN
ncbi:ABC transporter substrate binding protein [Algibacillus agarilyticus]|uniref:ABC transporter substrate binding protein n=1 Tax=Algibacillus agarilyticus TaxID=2234133 RepID=UPI0013003858|nr:ABC transporter substrate binding protein [Algibacillus agarilyticus]